MKDNQPTDYVSLNSKQATIDAYKSFEKRKQSMDAFNPANKFDKCEKDNCESLAIRKFLCKAHFSEQVRNALRIQFSKMYKTPINAFGYHDPEGLG